MQGNGLDGIALAGIVGGIGEADAKGIVIGWPNIARAIHRSRTQTIRLEAAGLPVRRINLGPRQAVIYSTMAELIAFIEGRTHRPKSR
jgi:hypothetical protein